MRAGRFELPPERVLNPPPLPVGPRAQVPSAGEDARGGSRTRNRALFKRAASARLGYARRPNECWRWESNPQRASRPRRPQRRASSFAPLQPAPCGSAGGEIRTLTFQFLRLTPLPLGYAGRNPEATGGGLEPPTPRPKRGAFPLTPSRKEVGEESRDEPGTTRTCGLRLRRPAL